MEEPCPDGHICILQATGRETVDATLGVVDCLGGSDQLVMSLRGFEALLLEDFLVVVEDPEVQVIGHGVHATVGLRAVADAGLAEVVEGEVGSGHRRVLEQRVQVEHPLALPNQALLDVQRNLSDVETRIARGELDHGLLTLLLLGDYVGLDLDASEFLELLLVLGEDVGARTGDKQHAERLALVFLPVETTTGCCCRGGCRSGGGFGCSGCSGRGRRRCCSWCGGWGSLTSTCGEAASHSD